MRILLDCRSVFPGMGGIGRATAGLAGSLPGALRPRDELLLLLGTRRPEGPLAPPPVEEVSVDAAMLDPAFEQARLPGLLDELRIDVYHGTCFATPIAPGRTARVATIHDVVSRRRPELVEPTLRAYLDRWSRVSAELAEAVVTVSEFSRRELASVYGRPAETIDVVPNAVDDAFRRVPRKPAPGRPYVLYVGSIEAKKNVQALLDAFGELLRREPALPHVLVLVGGRGGAAFDLEAAVQRVPGIAPRVHALGSVPDKTLHELLGSADAFVYPSAYEGFGLPPLEAMAAGVPTLVSDRTSLPEVVGDGADVVNPYDVDAFAAALGRLLRDAGHRERLVLRGRRRAASFTWAAAAQRLVAVYRRVHAAPPSGQTSGQGATLRESLPARAGPKLRLLAGGAS